MANYLPIDHILAGDGKNCWGRQLDKFEVIEQNRSGISTHMLKYSILGRVKMSYLQKRLPIIEKCHFWIDEKGCFSCNFSYGIYPKPCIEHSRVDQN